MAENEKTRNAKLAGNLLSAKAELAKAEKGTNQRDIARAQRLVDDAGYALWDANRRLVYRFANRFGDNEEYANEGLVALWEAIGTWDPDKGALTTWAFPRVKKAVIKAVAAQDHNLKLHAFLARVPVAAARESLKESLGREPTDAEVAKVAEVSESLVRTLRLGDAAGKAVSLNRPIDTDTELGDLLGTTGQSAEDEALESGVGATNLSDLDSQVLAKVTSDCTAFELWVGLRHTGADDGPPQEFAEMATQLGVSRERARKGFGRFVEKVADRMEEVN